MSIADKDKEVIRSFIDNEMAEDMLSRQEARERVGKGMVEITHQGGKRGHASNGLLISQNGLFVTCFHCVRSFDPLLKNFPTAEGRSVVMGDRKYPIENILAFDKQKDIALAKASIHGKVEPMFYRFYRGTNPIQRRTGLLHTVWGKSLCITEGLMNGVRVYMKKRRGDVRFVEMDVRHGDSGGIATDLEGRIFSIIFASWPEAKLALGIPWEEVLSFLSKRCV